VKRLLLRAPKAPFDIVSARAALDRNLIAGNAGNLVFLHAAYKLLDTRDAEIEVDRMAADPRAADRINERYDAYVVPLANAFRASFEPTLRRLTALIRRLRIPVVVLGVGAQSNLRYDVGRLERLEASARDFVGAVLDRGPAIGVRGEFTADWVRSLGFRDVDVIGCPSMFLFGPELPVAKSAPTLGRDAAIALNVSPYVAAMGRVIEAHRERYPGLVYVAQDYETLGMLLLGQPLRGGGARPELPVHPSHPLIAQDRVRLFIDVWPWIGFARTCDFTFGTRVHGNIASILAGTPAFVLAHDSRTLEIARYFGIPHRPISDFAADPGLDAARLYEEADYGPLVSGHRARFDRFADYLQRHGLRHVFLDGEDPRAFDARAERTAYPPPVDGRSALRWAPFSRLRFWAWRQLHRPAPSHRGPGLTRAWLVPVLP
jgi:hypothetical protein